MKYVALSTIVVAFVAAGCGSSAIAPSPNQPAFTAELKTSNEVPPITNAEQGGSGFANVVFNTTTDAAGNVTAATVTFVATYTGFPAGTPINLTHIHLGAAGVNGGVLINSGLTAATPLVLTSGSGTLTTDRITVPPALAQAIIANPAGYYFNSHTTLNPGGVVRGQLVRVP